MMIKTQRPLSAYKVNMLVVLYKSRGCNCHNKIICNSATIKLGLTSFYNIFFGKPATISQELQLENKG